MIAAAIDIGTNSVKLLVARCPGTRLVPVREEVVVTRLGAGLARTGRISRTGADRTLRTVARFVRTAGTSRVSLVGTRALRAAANARAVLDRFPVPVRILSARDEARLAFLAATARLRSRRVVAMDIGGGSAQVMTGAPGRLARSWSLPLGAVVTTERFLPSDPPSPREAAALDAFLLRRLARLPSRLARGGTMVGIGGTVAVLARNPVARSTLARLARTLLSETTAQRRRRGLPPGRADIVAAGAAVLVAAMKRLDARRLVPSPFGVRHGVLLEMSAGRYNP